MSTKDKLKRDLMDLMSRLLTRNIGNDFFKYGHRLDGRGWEPTSDVYLWGDSYDILVAKNRLGIMRISGEVVSGLRKKLIGNKLIESQIGQFGICIMLTRIENESDLEKIEKFLRGL